jgi:DNA-binding HxlR family transcriptional regulator
MKKIDAPNSNEENSACSNGTLACNVEKALDIIGGKWSFLIIKHLFDGTMRFGAIRKALHNISPKTLTMKLRVLEDRGVLTRKMYASIPPNVEYTLTAKGQDMKTMIEAMRAWGEKWI